MIKNQSVLQDAVAIAAPLACTTIGFLLSRTQVIRLTPLEAASNTGYVWRRVFLKGKK